MKSMAWEERVWLALKDAVSGMPPIIRSRALKKIINRAEQSAKARQARMVQAVDLWDAVENAVPGPIKPMCRNALKEAGL